MAGKGTCNLSYILNLKYKGDEYKLEWAALVATDCLENQRYNALVHHFSASTLRHSHVDGNMLQLAEVVYVCEMDWSDHKDASSR